MVADNSRRHEWQSLALPPDLCGSFALDLLVGNAAMENAGMNLPTRSHTSIMG